MCESMESSYFDSSVPFMLLVYVLQIRNALLFKGFNLQVISGWPRFRSFAHCQDQCVYITPLPEPFWTDVCSKYASGCGG